MEHHAYHPQDIEKQAQQYWDENRTFCATEDPNKEKFYCLAMFPYPSGRLHIGHVRNYTLGDVIARYERMQGKNVLHPIGWDAFGLPAENAAIQNKSAPAKWTYANIDHMRHQLKSLGLGYDWSRELATCKPDYYHWEQWLFTRLFKKGLVYRKNSVVNWDPVDQTVLANEQVVNGRGWRSGALIEHREIPQWFLKITDYADELLEDLNKLTGWPEQVRTMQRNWIGRSIGAEILFDVENHPEKLSIFTTRPDTLMGVTFMAIAIEHPLADIVQQKNPQIQKFIAKWQSTKMAEADIATQEKHGIDTGMKAIHPITGERIPIWIANFVLMEYGSGAVMGVPCNDERDFEFAKQYQLPIKQIIKAIHAKESDGLIDFAKLKTLNTISIEDGVLINSGDFTGLKSAEAVEAIINHLAQQKRGSKKVHYRLRDWGVSRQRYWGAPIPIIYCDDCGTLPVPEKDLPVVLPENIEFTGTQSPLKNMPEFYEVNCPQCGKKAHRETDTFDTFMESSWYYARYACPDQNQSMLDDRARYWTPVDFYIGGIEHAVLHLLYARFFHKLLRDEGLVNSDEPFTNLLTQGMVLKDGAKMSKSKGNTVDPQELIEKYGADTIRLFILFAAPPEQSLEWSDSGVEGCYRFLKRLWTFAYQCEFIKNINHHANVEPINWQQADAFVRDIRSQMHQILNQALYDFARVQFNTVVSACMKLLNLLSDTMTQHSSAIATNLFLQNICHEGLSILLRLLSPIVPHITHHLWREFNYGKEILQASWPEVDSTAIKTDFVQLVVQVNGKLRGQIQVPHDADQKMIEQCALQDPNIQKLLAGKNCKKIIVVPKRLVNLVVD